MIRNIPNKYTQAMLLDILEELCRCAANLASVVRPTSWKMADRHLSSPGQNLALFCSTLRSPLFDYDWVLG
jgi:hypothetical protein